MLKSPATTKFRTTLTTTFTWAMVFLVPVLILAIASPASASGIGMAVPSIMTGGAALFAIGALAPVVDSIDAVPEAARGAYIEKDGKFVLDVEIPDVSGLKTKNHELVGKLTAAQKRAALLGDRSEEEIKADLELAAKFKEDKAKAEGNFESLKEQLITQHKTELEKVTGRSTKVEGKLYDVLARREAEAAITAAGGNPKVLLPHVLPFIKVTEVDDDFTATVVDAKGKPRIADGAGTAMTIPQLIESFKADEAFGVAFAPSGASGGGARNNTGPAGSGAVVTIPKNATPQEYRRMKEDAEKRGVPYKVAE